MGKKVRPYILVASLILILIFILGVRYGQTVEKADKKTRFLISIPPTKAVPSEKPLNFKTFTSPGCALTFLYPSTLSVEKETSVSAKLTKDRKTVLEFSCQKISPTEILKGKDKLATPSLTFQNKKIAEQVSTKDRSTIHSFTIKNPVTNRDISFKVEENLLPLLERTLKLDYKDP